MRKLLLIVATTAAMFACAGPAMATESVSVVTEPGGTGCTTSTCFSGISSSGIFELRSHLFGIESHTLDCNVGFLIRISSGGTGSIDNFYLAAGDTECPQILSCSTPWPFDLEETGANVGQIDVSVCFDGPPLGECEGTISLSFHESATNHRYFLSVNDGSLAGESFTKCELTGAWVQSGMINGFEVVHQ